MMESRIVSCFVVLCLATLLSTPVSAQDVYVDASATGANTGESWTDAYTDLQDALDDADADPDITEIWVANGTYKPSVRSNPLEERSKTFQLINGVQIYGGFAGGESSLSDRNPERNRTTLSGDIDNDGLDDGNAYHVVSADDLANFDDTKLSGFTITGGYANGTASADRQGGGLRMTDSAIKITRCKFSDNRAKSQGAGLFIQNDNGSNRPYIVSCQFLDNANTDSSTLRGAGAACMSSTARFHGCLFHKNLCNGVGGGILSHNSALEIINCTFTENDAFSGGASEGGGIQIAGSGTDVITNCIFWDNDSDESNVEEDQIYLYSDPECPVVTYSDIMGCCTSSSCAQPCCIGADCDAGVGFCENSSDENIEENPSFCDQANDNLRIQDGSRCKEQGNDSAVPDDSADVDDDANTTEVLPWDLDKRGRQFQAVPGGTGVDMGAYEDQNIKACPEDLNNDGTVDAADLAILLAALGFNPGHPADLVCANNIVDAADRTQLLLAFGSCP